MTLPPQCNEGDLDERVCGLENTNEEFREKFYNQEVFNHELQENFKNQSLAFSNAIRELEKRIEELANRPCACN